MPFRSKRERERIHMQHFERMNGIGTVTSSRGDQKPVQYDLHIFQEEISVRTLNDPNATVLGMKEIRGRVEPICFSGDRDLKLQSETGGH